VDAREIAGKSTGVGRYLRGLLDAWAADPHAQTHEWILFAHARVQHPLGTTRLIAGSGGSWWEQRTLPAASRAARVDVLFSPAYTTPVLTSTPRVVTIHDLSYCAHPEWFRPRERLRRRWLTARAASAARAILTDSEFSRKEIVSRLGVPDRRVQVIYPGVTPRLVATRREAMILHVGSIFNRRHLPELVRGFARLAQRRRDLRLEIVGDDRTYPRQDLDAVAREEGVADRVRVRAYVDEATLDALYGSASALAFLSEYEGFGLTPLEALTAGVPPIVLDSPIAREIYGGAAHYVASLDPVAIEGALERALWDEPLRAAILNAAAGVLSRYAWQTAAAQTLGAIEGAAR
jgi:glycosyltransferase involved in cell wall biosynthesis